MSLPTLDLRLVLSVTIPLVFLILQPLLGRSLPDRVARRLLTGSSRVDSLLWRIAVGSPPVMGYSLIWFGLQLDVAIWLGHAFIHTRTLPVGLLLVVGFVLVLIGIFINQLIVTAETREMMDIIRILRSQSSRDAHQILDSKLRQLGRFGRRSFIGAFGMGSVSVPLYFMFTYMM